MRAVANMVNALLLRLMKYEWLHLYDSDRILLLEGDPYRSRARV